jgi:hypothetical protein
MSLMQAVRTLVGTLAMATVLLVSEERAAADATGAGAAEDGQAAMRAEIEALRREVAELRAAVAARDGAQPRDAAPAPPARPTPEWLDRLTIKGKTFLRYSYELGEAASDYNEFDIDRAYLEFHWRISDKARLRYTLEGGDIRDTDKDGKRTEQFDVTTKHLYLELQDPLHAGSYARFGQVDLPWVPFEEDLWQYRFQAKVLADREGYLTSTDLGATVGGTMPHERGSWAVAAVNGEGWKKNEIGKHKDAHARVTLRPFATVGEKGKQFLVGAFASVGTYDGISSGPDDRQRTIAHVGWVEKNAWTLAASYLWAEDPADKMKSVHPSLAARPGLESEAEGLSAWWILSFGAFSESEALDAWELVARYDRMDPDEEVTDNEHERVTLGVSHRFNKWAQVFVGFEEVDYDLGSLRDDEERFLVQAEIKF